MITHLGYNSNERPESRQRILDTEDHLRLVTLLAGLAVINWGGTLQLGLENGDYKVGVELGLGVHLTDVDLPVGDVGLLDDQFGERDIVSHSNLNLGPVFECCWRFVRRLQFLQEQSC